MLVHLSIRHFVLIDSLDLELSGGFVAITGETGAGKSIVFDAVALLVGGRARTDLIRAGEDQCTVQGIFELDAAAREHVAAVLAEAAIPMGDELVIRRVVSRQGSNRVFINDSPSTVALVARALDPLIEVVGQHDQLTLLRPDTHRDLVDRHGQLEALVAAMATAHARWHEARARVQSLEAAREKRAERIEFLRFQCSELEALNLQEGEMEALESALRRLRSIGQLREAAELVQRSLNDGDHSAVERVGEARDALMRVAGKDGDLDLLMERLNEVEALASDIASEARTWLRRLDSDDGDLDGMETRHETLRQTFRKYGFDESAALERLRSARQELEELEDFEDTLTRALAEETQLREAAEKQADRLAAARAKAANALFVQATKLLGELGMPAASLVWNAAGKDRLGAAGWEGNEILFSANTGVPAASIARVASGGELSRLLLAMKTVVASTDRLMTYTFDEVDAGIGGATAEVVGRMLAGLARSPDGQRQVLCVTHHPQIASFADVHLRADKSVEGGRTTSTILHLDTQGREDEIARMLGGALINEATRELARSLLAAGAALHG